ncbi:B12-binding domain-containing radical SAM protein [Thermodesulfobacteriota bacterium]
MKILLVNPYTELQVAHRLQKAFLHLEPLDLEITAGGVPEEDEVQILDLSLEPKPAAAYRKTLAAYRPDMVGLSGYSTTLHIVRQLAETAKRCLSEVITVVGGIHATLRPGDYATGFVDIIVRGEGGTAMHEIIRRHKAGEPLSFGSTSMSPHDPDFTTKIGSEFPEYTDVRDIPRPRRDLVDRSRYFCVWTSSDSGRLDTIFPRVASMRTSIGCSFSCSFCVIHQVMKKKYLQRDPEDVVDEIAGITEDHIYFVDDEMFINGSRVRRIAELLHERGIQKKYISWARSDTIVRQPDLFRLWREVGLDVVYVGLESMDESRLNDYKKQINSDTNRKAVSIIKECGIMLHASFIVHPDFSEEDFRGLEKTVAEISPAEITFTVLSPSPGTPMWYENRDRFICDPFRNYDCMHSLLPTKLQLRQFYQHFGRLYALTLRANPLRLNKVKAPLRDIIKAIIGGSRYIFSLTLIYKDYPQAMWQKAGIEQLDNRMSNKSC